MKHAAIIPLIGGEAIASTQVFGSRPDYILSYSAFKNNESHLLNYWDNEVPYYVLDEGGKYPHKVDVVSSVCPCAGLSLFSMGYGEHNPNNKWMIESAKYVLGQMKPRVFWGENAPGLAGKLGTPIRNQLIQIGRENGYTMTLYRTKSLLHGVPQIRERTFYFFWKGDKTPLLNYYDKPLQTIEDLITSIKSNTMNETINPDTPSRDDPYYRYLLEVVNGGISHREYHDKLEKYSDVKHLIEDAGHNYEQVGKWLAKNSYDKEAEKCKRMHAKLTAGGNIMRRDTILGKNYIGAFVGHYTTMLAHPFEDRYITYREALSIMGMPEDYQLLDPKKSMNHICQNVPVKTAVDMATEVLAVLNDKRSYLDASLVYQFNGTKKHQAENGSKRNIMEFVA